MQRPSGELELANDVDRGEPGWRSEEEVTGEEQRPRLSPLFAARLDGAGRAAARPCGRVTEPGVVMVGGRDHGPGGVCQSVGGGGGGWGGARGQGRAGDRRRRDATRGSGLLDRVLGVPSWALTLAAAARGTSVDASGATATWAVPACPFCGRRGGTLRCAAPATSRGTSFKLEVAGERPPLLPPVSSTSTSSYPTNAHVLTASFLPVIKSSPAQSSASLQLQLQLHSGTAAQAPAALAPSAPRPVAGRRASAVPGLARRSIQSSRASVPGDALPLTPDDALDATSLVQ
ncbi:hypothetical protein PCL_02118 [Purpureocillium lilacinum]|uniref:Uncharacterized protein n=1 Tax=Purpureocillium lilacinum TaxID=33203 RepID=A0A2U3E1H5_PURLI|nr:hypothetical protein PCL_02118 [Purpureocillium lilacinum]